MVLYITVSDGENMTLHNVMMGEVWLHSGQSNLEFPVKGWTQVLNADEEVAHSTHPNTRLLQICKVSVKAPCDEVVTYGKTCLNSILNQKIMKRLLSFYLIVVPLLLGQKVNATGRHYVLNYSSPSMKWMEAFPMGNGRLGMMVYGGTSIETIALNEVTLWSGQPDPEENNLCGPEKLREIRAAFFSDDIAKGNELGWKYLCGHGKSFGTHLPFGDLKIQYLHRSGNVSDYHRSLDLNEAVATVSYRMGGVSYRQQYFCSNPDDVAVIRLSANRKHSISFYLSMNMLRHNSISVNNDQIDILGDARFDKNGEGGVLFRGIVRVIPIGGTFTHDDKGITVSNADEVMILTDIRTNFSNPDYQNFCQQTIDKAVGRNFVSLRKAHVTDFGHIFNRMSVDFGGNLREDISTESLFAHAHVGHPDVAFDALFFQYGRYMLISSSRENSPLPANLQGIWNDNIACNMPWTCDYHLDINIEQNYWSANIANMAETNVPLFRYLQLLAHYGHETARKMYGCDGWVAHTINNIWGDTAPGNSVSWAMNVTAGAWLATQLWAHYDFTRDDEWLRTEGYPLMKQTAQFFVDYMVKDPNSGYLVTGPSISPENSFRYKDGKDYTLSMMPTIDRAVVHDIYKACIASSKILQVDSAFRARLECDIQLLPPYRIGKDSTLNEWFLNVSRTDPTHRHASHLLGLYPFGEISPEKTPALAKACEKFLYKQTHNRKWEDTEWSRGNMINFYARLKNADEAYRSLVGLYMVFMRKNLMTVSPMGVAGAQEDIFSFDATEAAVAGVCEMILQSYDGYLDFLPALPSQWKNGTVKGICARGGIQADIVWKDSKVVSAVLFSNTDQTVRCKINGVMTSVKLVKGEKKRI